MDTVGIETPRDEKRVSRSAAAAALVAVGVAALAGGYWLRASTEAATPAQTVIARGAPATWKATLAEANAVKRHAAAVEQARAIDIRMARVEE